MPDQLLLTILAAGPSSRLGRPKQLLMIERERLIHRQCRVALEAQIGPVAVVVGCEAEACAAAVADLPVQIVANLRWQEGLASSIGCAAQEAMIHDALGLLVFHVDQYRVSASELRELRDAWQSSGARQAVRSRAGKHFGPPAILPKSLFEACLELQGEGGAGSLLSRLPAAVQSEFNMPSAGFDIDVPADIPLSALHHFSATAP